MVGVQAARGRRDLSYRVPGGGSSFTITLQRVISASGFISDIDCFTQPPGFTTDKGKCRTSFSFLSISDLRLRN